jgi:1-acyl-sn-glycerol-3-phosphate acyltransferase
VPVIRDSGQAALDEGLRLLKAGRTVIIFPEGAISPLEGGCHKPHSGVMARLALTSGAPVIPVGIGLDRARVRPVKTEVDGVTEVGTWYLGGPYAMTVGEPLVFGGDVEDREAVRSVAEQIIGRIKQLARESSARLEAPAGQRVTRPVGVAHWAA